VINVQLDILHTHLKIITIITPLIDLVRTQLPRSTASHTTKMSEPTAPVVAPTTDAAPAVTESKPAASEPISQSTPAAPKVEESQAPTSPLSKLFSQLPSIIAEAGNQEMWGVELTNERDVPSSIVLEKFLRANAKDVEKAKTQLIEALKWRKSMNPVKLLKEVQFDSAKFGNLGFVTVYEGEGGKEIVTWNIYGGVKDIKSTFGDVGE